MNSTLKSFLSAAPASSSSKRRGGTSKSPHRRHEIQPNLSSSLSSSSSSPYVSYLEAIESSSSSPPTMKRNQYGRELTPSISNDALLSTIPPSNGITVRDMKSVQRHILQHTNSDKKVVVILDWDQTISCIPFLQLDNTKNNSNEDRVEYILGGRKRAQRVIFFLRSTCRKANTQYFILTKNEYAVHKHTKHLFVEFIQTAIDPDFVEAQLIGVKVDESKSLAFLKHIKDNGVGKK